MGDIAALGIKNGNAGKRQK